MSSHCSWQTPLDSNLFPCHGLSGKCSRSSKIMSAAVLEAVSLISKWPCPGISTETDMRQRILCAVQRHELGAVCHNTQICRWFIYQLSLESLTFFCATWDLAALFSMRLATQGFMSRWVAPQNADAAQVRLERKLRRHKLGTSKRTNAVTAHTVKRTTTTLQNFESKLSK